MLLKTNNLNLQIASAHFPSHLNTTPGEFYYHVREWWALLHGSRRHRILVGIDTNVQIESNKYRETNFFGGSTHLSAMLASMRRRGVHEPLAMAYIT